MVERGFNPGNQRPTYSLKISQRGEAALTPRRHILAVGPATPQPHPTDPVSLSLPGRIEEFFEKVYESAEALALPH